MDIILSPTVDFVDVDEVRCRMWDGRTASGIPVQAVIVRVAPLRFVGQSTEAYADACRQFAAEAGAAGMIPPDDPGSRAQVIRDVS